MEEKFTPGPWCMRIYGKTQDSVTIHSGDNTPLASLYFLGQRKTYANGMIMAAAPDMYHALQKLVGVLDDCRRGTDEGNIPPGILDRFDEATNTCRAALQKARGEE